MGQLLGNVATRTARKQHDCWWCGEPIRRGQRFVGWTWLDGEPLEIRTHQECREAWDRLRDDDEVCFGDHFRCGCERPSCECGTYPPHDLLDWLGDCWRQDTPRTKWLASMRDSRLRCRRYWPVGGIICGH